MKIYIEPYNYKLINIDNLLPYLHKKHHFKEIYTEHGMFRIENGKYFNKIDIIDGDVSKIIDYLPDINIIVDKSIIKKDRNFVSHLPNNYILVDTFLETYILRDNSPLQLIIEKDHDNNIKNFYFTFGAKFKGYSNADIINFSIKEDFQSFINLFKS